MNKKILYQNEVDSIEIFLDIFDTFGICVKLKDFSGKFNFRIEQEILIKDIKNLSKIYDKLEGECIMDDMDSDSYLKFSFKKYGKLIIYGRLGGTHQPNYLVFEMEADQTLLKNIIDFLKQECVH